MKKAIDNQQQGRQNGWLDKLESFDPSIVRSFKHDGCVAQRTCRPTSEPVVNLIRVEEVETRQRSHNVAITEIIETERTFRLPFVVCWIAVG